MKKQSIWRFVVQIVGVSLALAGLICLLVAYWDKLVSSIGALCNKCKGDCASAESEDYEDELLYE